MDTKSFGARLRRWIELRYESQYEACIALEIQTSTLYRYMKGTTQPTAGILEILAKSGCNLNWLLTGEGSLYAQTRSGQELKQLHEEQLQQTLVLANSLTRTNQKDSRQQKQPQSMKDSAGG